MSNLITDSLKYPARSDTFLRTVAVGGVIVFVNQLFLGAVFMSVTSRGGPANSSYINQLSMGVWGGLTLLGLVSFIVLAGFYVRIAEGVIAGQETPPSFANSKRLVVTGLLYYGTLLTIIAVALALQLAVFTILVVSLTVLDVFLGISFADTAIRFLSYLFAVVAAVSVVYPQPSIWILIARFNVWGGSSRSYLRFVLSRRFLSELLSILFDRRYASSWMALIVVSVLHGAATIEGSGLLAVNEPGELIIRLNSTIVSAIVGFYTSVAVVFIFARRFREPAPSRQTSFREFESVATADDR